MSSPDRHPEKEWHSSASNLPPSVELSASFQCLLFDLVELDARLEELIDLGHASIDEKVHAKGSSGGL